MNSCTLLLNVFIGWLTMMLMMSLTASAQLQEQSLIKISKETTWIEKPLDRKGFVDYEAWINQKYGEGLKPDQNALVDLLKIFGPREMDEEVRNILLRRLQLKGFSQARKKYRFAMNYLLVAAGVPDQLKKVEDPMEAMMIRMMAAATYSPPMIPWKREDHPELAPWLDEMGDTLEEVASALGSKKIYVPIVLNYEGPISPFKPNLLFGFESNLFEHNYLLQDLIVRAMYHLGSEELDECEHYLLAARRLALMLSNYPFAKHDAVAVMSDYFTLFDAECRFASDPAVTADRILKYRVNLKKLVPLDFLLDVNDVGLRIEILYRITRAARWLDGERQLAIDDALNSTLSESEIKPDWNAALTITNEFVDRLVKALRTADYTESKQLFDTLLEDLNATNSAEPDEPAEITMARKIVAKIMPSPFLLISASRDYRVSEVTADMYLAIWAYKKDHGSFPESLKQLVPKYCDEVRTDPFSGEEIIYRRLDEEFVIYSVERDGKDEIQTKPFDPKEIFFTTGNLVDVRHTLLGFGSRVYAKNRAELIRRIIDSQ